MPSKKKKYNARFPAGRIKKIMQTDEEVGKVAQAVPVIISRTLELFVESLLTKSTQITLSRNAKTLTPSHMKQCILSESRFDFLKDLVKNIPDASIQEDNENNAMEAIDYSTGSRTENAKDEKPETVASVNTEQSTSMARTPVIQYTPKIAKPDTVKAEPGAKAKPEPVVKVKAEPGAKVKVESEVKVKAEPEVKPDRPVPALVPTEVPKLSFSIENLVRQEPKECKDLSAGFGRPPVTCLLPSRIPDLTPIVPAPSSNYGQNVSDNLYIDEDYDN